MNTRRGFTGHYTNGLAKGMRARTTARHLVRRVAVPRGAGVMYTNHVHAPAKMPNPYPQEIARIAKMRPPSYF
jgi:hypothetical protein